MLFYNISKFFEHPYREDLLVKINFFASILVNVFIWFILWYKLHAFAYTTESGQIYLHYNIYFGIDNIGYWANAFIIPALGLFVIVFNNILGYTFYLQEKIVSYLFAFSQSILQVILLSAAIFLILLNI